MKNERDFLHFLIYVFFLVGFVTFCASDNVKKSVDENREDNGETEMDSLDIPADNESSNNNNNENNSNNNINNITCTRRQNSRVHEIRSATFKQYPFMAAIISHDQEYLCSGVVVSNGLILTTGKCTQQAASHVLLNATVAKKSDDTILLHITKKEKFPSYTGGDSMKDVGLIYTEKHNSTVASKIKLSNFTNARNIIDVEALGYGLNSEVGDAKELQSVGVEHRAPFGTPEYVMLGYLDCIETKVLSCYKDTGGPALFDDELVGIVKEGQDVCVKEMTAAYAVNKKMVEILPTYAFKAWLDEKIKKNEEQEKVGLATYPAKPSIVRRGPVKTVASAGNSLTIYNILTFNAFLCLTFKNF